jgi:hypothetical protein
MSSVKPISLLISIYSYKHILFESKWVFYNELNALISMRPFVKIEVKLEHINFTMICCSAEMSRLKWFVEKIKWHKKLAIVAKLEI